MKLDAIILVVAIALVIMAVAREAKK